MADWNGGGADDAANTFMIPGDLREMPIRIVLRQLIERVLRESRGDKSKAARRLGLTRKELYGRLRLPAIST